VIESRVWPSASEKAALSASGLELYLGRAEEGRRYEVPKYSTSRRETPVSLDQGTPPQVVPTDRPALLTVTSLAYCTVT
jgi:hypothetical protein